MNSMTGFGFAEATSEKYQLKVEIKSVNHKYLDIKTKGFSEYLPLEMKVKDFLGQKFNRGHIEVNLFIEKKKVERLVINEDLFKAYVKLLQESKNILEDKSPIEAEWILGKEGVIQKEPEESMDCDFETVVLHNIEKAAYSLESMRKNEGAILQKDIEEKLKEMESLHRRIHSLSIESNNSIGMRWKMRMKEIQREYSMDENKIYGEIALLIDKISIEEEIIRLSSHIQQFNDIMKAKDSVGRKLDFLLQEMNREANTIGSKSRDSKILHDVVTLKALIENIREQVQNIE